MTTLQDLIGQVRSHARDDDGTYVTDADITAAINTAYADIASRVEIFEQQATGTTSTTITLPTAPELIEIYTLQLDGDPVEFVTDTVWESWSDAGDSPDHTLGRIFDDVIELYPTPSSAAYVLRYKRLPTALVDGSDVVEMPGHLVRKLIYYGRFEALMKQGRSQDAAPWLGMYEDGLPAPSSGTERNMVGAHVSFAPNSFDLDPSARHLG